jgi:hypothetical protein
MMQTSSTTFSALDRQRCSSSRASFHPRSFSSSSSSSPRRRSAPNARRRISKSRIRFAKNDDGEEEEEEKELTEYEKKLLRQKETRDVRNLFISFSLGAAAIATLAVSSSSSGVYNIDFMDAFTERDPVRSFSVYGEVSKEYKVNKYDDIGHIIGRQRGVSVNACAQLVPYSGDSRGDKGVTRPPNDDFRVCEVVAQPLEKVETVADIAPSCERACRTSCREATKAYDSDQKKRFGFGFDKEEEGKVLQACGRQCNANCIKSGTGQYNFLIPFRF